MRFFKRVEVPDISGFLWRKWYLNSGATLRKYQADFENSLQVRKRAAEDGRNNIPAQTETEPGLIEHQIRHRFDTHADALKQALWRGKQGLLERVTRLIPEVLDFKAVAEATEIGIKRIRDRARDDIAALRKRERDQWRNLKSFQAKNGLQHRNATYSQPWPMRFVFWIALGMIVDSIINGGFFAARSPDYWEGGVFQAFSFSLVNVLLGCILLGLISARYANHVVAWKRYAGIAGVVFALAAGVLWNAYVGHYRQLLEAVPLDQIDALSNGSYVDAFAHMRDHPFNLPSWQAVVLLVIGFAIFIAMAVEGYRADDPYPRFGHHDRAYKKALGAYVGAKAKLTKAVENEIDKTAKRLEQRLEADARKVVDARKLVAAAAAFQREMTDSAADLVRAATVTTQTYREINGYVRSTPPPAYFKDRVVFAVELPETSMIADKYGEAVAALEANRRAANDISRFLNDAAKTTVEELDSYVEGIENEVARQGRENVVPLAAE